MMEIRGRRIGPEEGWSSIALVAMLGLILATAIDEPAWVNGRGSLTDCLATCALLGALAGFAGPKLGWGRWTTHVVGALFAGILLPVIAGRALLPTASLSQAFQATADATVQAYLDLAWRGRQFTTQELHYVLVLGGIVWGTMQFGSYAVFGHRRPLAAVVMVGLVLLANMALTRRDQLFWLVAFTGVSLLLLVQMHAFDERATWVRRRIGDPGSISAMYLRGGTVFIVLAVAASLVLTQRAASSPLAGAWSGLDSHLVQVGEQIGRLFPVGGDLRGGGGVAFGSSARIAGQWFSDDGVAFTASVPSDAGALPWRAATYDKFVLGGWEQTDVASTDVAAGDPLLAASAENPSPDLTRQVQVSVRPADYHDTRLLSLGMPTATNLDANVQLTGTDGWFAGADVRGDTPYTVAASVLRLGENDAITGNKLRVAGQAYPADIVAHYTAVPAGAIGPDAQDLLKTILALTPSRNPYDLALAMQAYLQGPTFTYTTDVRGLNCSDPSAVECFARYKQGYCLHYASTMAILLRAALPDQPIPTRLVQGFLPGTLIGTTETVLNRNAHAWVEVYFPGYGWIPFDPTGGGVGRPSEIKDGPVVPAPTPSLGPATSGRETPRPSRREFDLPGGDAGTGATPPQQPADRGLAAVLVGLLVVALGALAAVAWWRGPRGEVSPESAWASVSRSASRFGFAPRPTQTVYEYAASLGDLVPVARPDIHTVAEAKVETAYAKADLSDERRHAVTTALRRLRLPMLRLAFLRVGRRLDIGRRLRR
jgi:transglutaminase-like putative cysteine protease